MVFAEKLPLESTRVRIYATARRYILLISAAYVTQSCILSITSGAVTYASSSCMLLHKITTDSRKDDSYKYSNPKDNSFPAYPSWIKPGTEDQSHILRFPGALAAWICLPHCDPTGHCPGALLH